MTTDRGECFLIACRDERSKALARVLNSAGKVFRCALVKSSCSIDLWTKDDWHAPGSERVPDEFSALFVHLGQNDPLSIPTNVTFGAEFAFSTPGVTEVTLRAAKRSKAIPIERPFTTTSCPVKKHHLDQLLKFLSGQRKQTPTFCGYGGEVPTLWSIVILCEAYVAAGIAARADALDKQFRITVYPEPLLREAILLKRHDLARLWPIMHNCAWWMSRLGFWDAGNHRRDENAYRLLLQQLATELDIIDDICGENSVSSALLLSDAQLESGIGEPSPSRFPKGPPKDIITFLKSAEPWKHAKAAYDKAKEILGE